MACLPIGRHAHPKISKSFNMKNKFTLIIAMCFLSFSAFSQQEDQFTQFMYYKMGFNPGYAGSNDGACISLIARNQWLGLEGAPQTQLLTFNMPLFNKKVGVGASVIRHTIGITERYTGEAVYSYRIRMGRGTLGIGVQGSLRLLRMNYSEAEATQPIESDNAIPGDLQSKYIPNFGAGLYYSDNRFYIGFSIPRFLENNIDLADLDQTISKEVTHMYLMGGLLIDLGDKVKMQPQMLLKYVKSAPFDGDANLNFIFADRITAGLSYRIGGSKRSGIGESIGLVLGAQLSDSILFGISYDATLSELRSYSNGSVEGVFRYCIGGRSEGEEYVSPRFF